MTFVSEKDFMDGTELALHRLIHDGGIEIAKELTHQNGNNAISIARQISAQIAGGAGEYGLDFKALGASEEQLARIAAHQADRRALADAFAKSAPASSRAAEFEPRRTFVEDEDVRDVGRGGRQSGL